MLGSETLKQRRVRTRRRALPLEDAAGSVSSSASTVSRRKQCSLLWMRRSDVLACCSVVVLLLLSADATRATSTSSGPCPGPRQPILSRQRSRKLFYPLSLNRNDHHDANQYNQLNDLLLLRRYRGGYQSSDIEDPQRRIPQAYDKDSTGTTTMAEDGQTMTLPTTETNNNQGEQYYYEDFPSQFTPPPPPQASLSNQDQYYSSAADASRTSRKSVDVDDDSSAAIFHETVQERVDHWRQAQIDQSARLQQSIRDDQGRLKLLTGVSRGSRAIIFLCLVFRNLHLFELADQRLSNNNNQFWRLFVVTPLVALFVANMAGVVASFTSPSQSAKRRLKAILNMDKLLEVALILWNLVRLTVFPSKFIPREIFVSSILHSVFFIMQCQAFTRLTWDERAGVLPSQPPITNPPPATTEDDMEDGDGGDDVAGWRSNKRRPPLQRSSSAVQEERTYYNNDGNLLPPNQRR